VREIHTTVPLYRQDLIASKYIGTKLIIGEASHCPSFSFYRCHFMDGAMQYLTGDEILRCSRLIEE